MIPGIPDGVLYVVAAMLLAIGLIVWAKKRERERTAEFRRTALHLGWSDTEIVQEVPEGVAQFHLFNQGRARIAKAVLRGRPGRFEATLLDYQYTTGSGKNSHTHRQTVLVFELPDAELPEFELRPENLFHKIGAKFGYQDINLDNRPDFSKIYLLRGEDEARIRSLFGGELVHHLEQNRGWSLNGGGKCLVVFRAGRRPKPEDLSEFLRECDRVATLVAGR